MSEEELFIYRFMIAALFASLVSGFISGLFLLNLLDSRVFDENGKLLPGPIHYLWGKNYLTILRIARTTKQYSKAIYELLLNDLGDGNIAAYRRLDGDSQVVVGHPDMAKSVLSAHELKFQIDTRWRRLRELFGDNPITCHEKSWNRFKNVTGPAFRSHSLKGMISVFNIHARRILRHWYFRLNKQELQSGPKRKFITSRIDNDFRHVMIGVMCEAGFGFDFYINEKADKVAADFQTIWNEYVTRMEDPTDWWHKLWNSRHSKVRKALRSFKEMISAAYEDRKIARSKSGDEPLPEHHDLLELLMDSNEQSHPLQQFSGAEIVDSVFAFMFLGFESTAVTLMWVIYELSCNPEIQEKCAQEVDAIMTVNGVQTSAVVYDDIPKFSVLIQVLKETLRLHPPVPEIVRKCTAPCRLGEFNVKKGSNVAISVLALHRHPDYWYLPNQFFPERFSQENVLATIKHPFQYIPFGGGTRNCIGQRFGQMAVVVIMAVLLSKFHFSLPSPETFELSAEERLCLYPTDLKVAISLRTKEGR